MKSLLCFITLFFLTLAALGQTNWQDTSSSDMCIKLQNQANLNKLHKTNHSRPLVIANGTIIRAEEINEKQVDTIYIIKCPQSFEKFGNIGALGVIYLDTKQTFDAIRISNLATIKQSHGATQKTVYAVNGYLFADPSRTISRRAIKKVDILKNYELNTSNSDEAVTCISIWTITKKEIKDDNSIPKPCRGISFASIH